MAPRYRDPYLMGSTIMAIELNEIEMAVRLLQKGLKTYPESGYSILSLDITHQNT